MNTSCDLLLLPVISSNFDFLYLQVEKYYTWRTEMDANHTHSGGFLPSLPSPSPSNTTSSSQTTTLPHPRSHPLKPGSAKEDAARRYVETRLLHISRRYTKKFQPVQENEDESVKGYESMSEVAKD